MKRAWLLSGVVAVVVLAGAMAVTRAGESSQKLDWPLYRHDPQRTALVENKADLTEPAVAWKRFLGGSLPMRGIQVADVNRDGVQEILMTVGGRVVAKLPDDRLVWDTRPAGFSSILAVEDLDGDGVLDVVAVAPNLPFGQVSILSGRDGTLQWESPLQDAAFVGATYLADLDGD
ncbi:MAG: FG-GAP repeat protein, partial [Deltaproteobacteria bacterium]|nr:FG-GAP repeat protein [Deltaproteobacteria bacterium]